MNSISEIGWVPMKKMIEVIFCLIIVAIVCGLCAKKSMLPDKDNLENSRLVYIENINYTENGLKVKFSNTSSRNYYIEAKGLECLKNGKWQTVSHTKPAAIYILTPDFVWNEGGWKDDDMINVLTEKKETWEIKSLHEEFGELKSGKYNLYYIITDKEHGLEMVSCEFDVP